MGQHIIRTKLHKISRAGAITRGQQNGFKKCNRFGGSGCLMCHYVTPTTTHISGVTGESFPIQNVITCTTKNVIYDIWCDRCRNSAASNPGSDQYTGKSENTAAERFTGHRSDVTTGKVYKAVSNHFNMPGHKLSDMRFLPFEVVRNNDPMYLASREQFWIEKNQTFALGLNRQK